MASEASSHDTLVPTDPSENKENGVAGEGEDGGDVENLRDTVQSFALSLHSPSASLHSSVVKKLLRLWKRNTDEGESEVCVRAVTRVLVARLLSASYQPSSLKAFRSLLLFLNTSNNVSLLTHLTDAVIQLVKIRPHITVSASKGAVNVACIYASVLSHQVSDANVLKKVMEALALLSYYAFVFNPLPTTFSKKVVRWLKLHEGSELVSAISPLGDSESFLSAAALISLSHSTTDDSFLAAFSKLVLLAKFAPSHHLTSACAHFLKHLTLESFQSQLLPSIKKALLRSPEVAVYGIRVLFESINFPVDSVLDEVLKTLLGLCSSGVVGVRSETLSTLRAVARNCRVEGAKKVVNALVAHANGTKQVDEKAAVIECVGQLEWRSVSGTEKDSLLIHSINALIKSTGEASDAVVVNQWNAVLSLAKQVEKASDLSFLFTELGKLSGSSREAALRCLALLAYEKGEAVVADTYKKAALDNALKAKEVCESACACVIALCSGVGGDVQKVISALSSNDNLLKEKTISGMRDEDALVFIRLIERSVQANVTLGDGLVRLFLLCCVWRRESVRSAALSALASILPSHSAFAAQLASTLYESVDSSSIHQLYSRVVSGEEGSRAVVAPHLLIPIISHILSPSAHLPSIAAPSLLLASLPSIVSEDGSLWLRWLHSNEMKSEWSSFLVDPSTLQLFVHTIFSCSNAAVRGDALTLLFCVATEELKDALWKHTVDRIEGLTVREYTTLSEKDVQIWKCPEGTLFNTDVLDFDESAEAKNVKRENKAYKFSDQLAEIQLKKELAEKRRKEGKLTPKQKELMEKELAKEKTVRERVAALWKEASGPLGELHALVQADGKGAIARYSLLLNYVVPFLTSPLLSKDASEAFAAFFRAAFNDSEDHLYSLGVYSSLRVLNSLSVAPEWSEESKESQLSRVLALLVDRTFVVETGEDTEEEAALLYEDALGAAHLSVLYPIFSRLVKSDGDEGVLQKLLLILNNAMNRRLLVDDGVLSLPLVPLTSLLISFASSTAVPSLSVDALSALGKLVSLVNETGKVSLEVSEMVIQCLQLLTNSRVDLRENSLKIVSAHQLLSRVAVLSEDANVAVTVKSRLLQARFDKVEAIGSAASQLWFASLFSITQDLFHPLTDDVCCGNELVRECAAKALLAFLVELPSEMPRTLSKLNELYQSLRAPRKLDAREIVRGKPDTVDPWRERWGVAKSALIIAQVIEKEEAMALVNMVVPDGLNDRVESIRDTLTAAAVQVVMRHGASLLEQLLPLLEGRLVKLPDGKEYDNERQGLIVLLGTLARYVEDESKVAAIVARLVEALSTPAQKVQEAVCACLTPLVPSIRDPQLLPNLQKVLWEGSSYAHQRGAAYGIAGLVKGMGIPAVRERDFMVTVQKALLDKSTQKKQGALLALEMLSGTVGKLFEPYLMQGLSGLLVCFGDSDGNVRRAAEDASRSAMGALSAHGMKCILPKVLEALENDSWRTKCAAVDVLGSVAFCAPKQLSSCLPSIVPRLMEVLADSHSKVRASGEGALKKIGSVIQNPEILGVAPQVMQGLIDPATKTSFALNTIVNTKFVHYIDAASLALMMPIIRRAFEDRNSETRRLAAQIISNIYKLAQDKDMEPYLADMVPGLQKALMDAVPEIRTVAAKALGAVMARSRGETAQHLHSHIIPWLKEKLVSEQSTVDRSGAAQGLSEVLAGVGQEQLDYVMPEIITATESSQVSAETRDGYILMYIYLPMVFGDRFLPYLPRVMPSILKALADENEYVRASALKAGQRLIGQFVSHARKMILPQLLEALNEDNWRIRHAGVTLIGDFLFNVSGISGKSTSNTTDEDDTMGMEQAGKSIVRALGQRCRDDVLAALYLARSDVALTVRQGAGHVWKMVVSNTPRTLREMMKTLFEKVLESLACACEERQQGAARCLGELVRKMGEKIIVEVLPVLDEYLKSEDEEKRLGVAVALNEIVSNMSKEVVVHYMSGIVVPLQKTICDESDRVRASAAHSFHVFFNSVGMDAYDEVVGPLVDKLTAERDSTLEGLATLMQSNSRYMLPFVLPRLTRKPVKVNALCVLAAASGDSLGRQLSRILDSLLAAAERNDQYEAMIEPCEEVVLSVVDEEGIATLLQYAFNKASEGNVPAAVLLHTFMEKTTADLEEFSEQIITGSLQLYSTSNEQIADHIILALIAFTKKLDTTQLMQYIPLARKSVGKLSLSHRGKQLQAFTHPKSLNALVSFFREGVMQGAVEVKGVAAEGLGVVVGLASAEAVKPHVVSITGPLIRVLGDRFPPSVKEAILQCLSQLLDKVGTLLRPFLPQLQSTFMKALQDSSSRGVRLCAAGALTRLIRFFPKPESLLVEMSKLIAATSDKHLLETTLVAARGVVANATQGALSEGALREALKASESCVSGEEVSGDVDECITVCAGALMGQAAALLDVSAQNALIAGVSGGGREGWARAVGVQWLCKCAPSLPSAVSALSQALQSDANVASAAARAIAYIIMREGVSSDAALLSTLARAINHQSTQVRRVVGVALGTIFVALQQPLTSQQLKGVVIHLVNGSKESNSAVRNASEVALVHAFQLQKGQSVYEEYLNSCDGAAKNVLIEVHRSLTRIVKSGDIGVDNLDNVLTAP